MINSSNYANPNYSMQRDLNQSSRMGVGGTPNNNYSMRHNPNESQQDVQPMYTKQQNYMTAQKYMPPNGMLAKNGEGEQPFNQMKTQYTNTKPRLGAPPQELNSSNNQVNLNINVGNGNHVMYHDNNGDMPLKQV